MYDVDLLARIRASSHEDREVFCRNLPSPRTAEDAVANGAAFLDRFMFAWSPRISLETLDIQRENTCILGQLFGRYSRGKVFLGMTDPNTWWSLGFASSTYFSHGQLNVAWAALLAQRAPA